MANRKSSQNHNGEKERQMVMDIMLNKPQLDFGEMAKECGMSRDQFYKIRTSEGFYDEYHTHCVNRFKAIEQTAIRRLNELCEQGNFQAIKYVLDGLNYAPTERKDINITGGDISISITGDETEM